MSGIDNIIEKITAQAQSEIDEILANANAEAEAILKDAKTQAEALSLKLSAEAEKTAQNEKSRIISMADSQSRKLRLSDKQALIDECFALAQKKLTEMPKDEYIALLCDMILSQVTSGKEEIMLGASDKEKIGADLIAKVNKSRDGLSLTLSEKALIKNGGFIIKDGDIEYNNTFETLLASYKEQLVTEVASCLFK